MSGKVSPAVRWVCSSPPSSSFPLLSPHHQPGSEGFFLFSLGVRQPSTTLTLTEAVWTKLNLIKSLQEIPTPSLALGQLWPQQHGLWVDPMEHGSTGTSWITPADCNLVIGGALLRSSESQLHQLTSLFTGGSCRAKIQAGLWLRCLSTIRWAPDIPRYTRCVQILRMRKENQERIKLAWGFSQIFVCRNNRLACLCKPLLPDSTGVPVNGCVCVCVYVLTAFSSALICLNPPCLSADLQGGRGEMNGCDALMFMNSIENVINDAHYSISDLCGVTLMFSLLFLLLCDVKNKKGPTREEKEGSVWVKQTQR